jgi:hypothetical protein
MVRGTDRQQDPRPRHLVGLERIELCLHRPALCERLAAPWGWSDRRDKKRNRRWIDGVVVLAMPGDNRGATGRGRGFNMGSPGVMKMMANRFYLVGSICFIVGTIINMTAR